MARWIRRTPPLTLQDIPVVSPTRAENVQPEEHTCQPPAHAAAGPRSVWECDCGQRWRITMPYWRPIGKTVIGPSHGLPRWVLDLGNPSDGEQRGLSGR